jgi:hypothetical protein
MVDGNTNQEGEVLVGAKISPDGSLDTSHAAHWIMDDEERDKFNKGLKQLDEKNDKKE